MTKNLPSPRPLLDWYAPLRTVVSRGSQIDPVGGLAGLAAAREQHLGQFFTPESVVRFMWSVVGLTGATIENRDGVGVLPSAYYRWHLLDNSFGSGRMFAPADPSQHVLHGIEVDRPLAEQVGAVASSAGFAAHLRFGSMVDAKLAESQGRGGYGSRSDRFHVGLINPPFSLHFDSPAIAGYRGLGCFGKFGPASSCVSQQLAVAQALAWCERVVAVVPRSFAVSTLAGLGREGTRLHAVFHLPRSVFRSEGAEVDVSVLVWREETSLRRPAEITIDAWPIGADVARGHGLPTLVRERYDYGRNPALSSVYAPEDKPATRLPITGDRSIRLSHDGRRIVVSAVDAAAYVQAMNVLLVRRTGSTDHRRVRRSIYAGQGKLDIETLLAQPDPRAALENVIESLTLIGLQVSLDPSFGRYFARRTRQLAIDVAPFGHTALVEDGGFADWLAEQTEVRAIAKPDTFTQRAWNFCEPGLRRACPFCTKVEAVELDEGDDVEDEAEVDDEPAVVRNPNCWKCHGRGTIDLSLSERRLRVSPEPITIVRGCPLHKEARSVRRWSVTLNCDGGTEKLTGKPITRLVGESWLESEIAEAFTFPDFAPFAEGWTPVHASLSERFPVEFAARMKAARDLGIDRWLWEYQLHDLCEINMKRGAIIAWEMGLGKARLAAALCLLGGKHNVITVETRLIREMETEFRAIGLPASTWQTITKPEQCEPGRLRRINLISYDKLKSTLPGKKRTKHVVEIDPRTGKPTRDKPRTWDVRHTFAGLLRRRVHTHVCDEGHLLANHTTQQSRAVMHVSSKGKCYLLTGTPISNYPRDVVRLMQWAAGDGTASQIFGNRWPLMRAKNIDDFGAAPRGVDEFRERFVTLQWVTREFEDEMEEGAKREIPIIADVPGFRRVVQHIIKRRVAAEPEVARFVRIPVPTIIDEIVPWDADHFALYQSTSAEFVDWYKREYAEQTGDKKGAHLIAVLRKLYAVYCAANFPQGGVDGQPAWTGGDTTKQRRTVELLATWASEGHKSIVLAEGPRIIDHIAVRLRELDLDVVTFHGGISITKRVDAMDKRFREGKAQVLAATKGTLQTGYNLAAASRVLAYDGTWTPKTEHQAFARVLRPQQRRDVTIVRMQLRGSIDEYQRQMVDQKSTAMRSGLDYGAGAPNGTEFKHLDRIFAQFVSDFEATQEDIAA